MQQQKKPISPQEMFHKLLSTDFRELECVDEAATIKQQLSILSSLIVEYKCEIDKRLVQREQCQIFRQKSIKLRTQLDKLKLQRQKIQTMFTDEQTKLKLNPAQLQQQTRINAEIDEMRAKNTAMALKIKQLHEYIFKLNQNNGMLEKQKKIIQVQAHSRNRNCCSNYGQRLQKLKRQQQAYEYQYKLKMRQREQQSLLELQHQEAQIQARNRKRMASFQHPYL